MAVNLKFLFRPEFNFFIFAENFGSILQVFSRRRNPAARIAAKGLAARTLSSARAQSGGAGPAPSPDFDDLRPLIPSVSPKSAWPTTTNKKSTPSSFLKEVLSCTLP